eukprot:762413_1
MFMQKRTINPSASQRRRKRRKKLDDDFLFMDEEAGSDFEGAGDDSGGSDEDLFENETADEKRIRLAKEHLKKLEGSIMDMDNVSESEEDEPRIDKIDAKLQSEAMQARGRLHTKKAEGIKEFLESSSDLEPIIWRGHKKPITSVSVADTQSDSAGVRVFSTGKDGVIIGWRARDGAKVHTQKSARKREGAAGHKDAILDGALSSDGKLLATAGKGRHVLLWDATKLELVHTFKGHRDAVTSLAFRLNSHTLYSGSADRTIKIWNCDAKTYVDTLFGPKAAVNCIDALMTERVLATGTEKVARVFKIPEETQLLFSAERHHSASVDCCCMINNDLFVCGGQDGALSLWSTKKKKPLYVERNAHGGKWICSLAALRYSDVIASGSSDGHVRLWQVAGTRLVPLSTLRVNAFVTGLAFAPSGHWLVGSCGPEHRLGRWDFIRGAKNEIRIWKLSAEATDEFRSASVDKSSSQGDCTVHQDAIADFNNDVVNDNGDR